MVDMSFDRRDVRKIKADINRQIMRYFLLTIIALLIPVEPKCNEIPLEAILGDKINFSEWKQAFSTTYTNGIDNIKGMEPVDHKIISSENYDGIELLTIQFRYPLGSILFGKPSGGILLVPKKSRNNNIIIAIHGHENDVWGRHATNLIKRREWPYILAKKGYKVWLPVSMYHEEIKDVAEFNGYILTWVKIITNGIDYCQKNIWNKQKSGYVVMGLSSGGVISYSMMAYRSDISVGVFAGAEQDLDFLRREYKIKGHPDCWDIKGVKSYTAVQSLIPPRPIQFQSGRKDQFFPHGRPLEKKGDWFLGTSRGQLSAENGGNALVLRSIYEIYDKKNNFSYLIHDGGHEIVVDEAIKFIESHKEN